MVSLTISNASMLSSASISTLRLTMTNYDQLSERAKQIYGNVEDAMQDAEEMEGVSGVDYLNLMQEIIDEASKRKSNHERSMDDYILGR